MDIFKVDLNRVNEYASVSKNKQNPETYKEAFDTIFKSNITEDDVYSGQKKKENSSMTKMKVKVNKKPEPISLIGKIDEIKKLAKEGRLSSIDYFNVSKELGIKYNVPTNYVLSAIQGNGIFSQNSEGKLVFTQSLTTVGIGTQRMLIWREDGFKQIVSYRINGNDITSYDGEEYNDYIKLIDRSNRIAREEMRQRMNDELRSDFDDIDA